MKYYVTDDDTNFCEYGILEMYENKEDAIHIAKLNLSLYEPCDCFVVYEIPANEEIHTKRDLIYWLNDDREPDEYKIADFYSEVGNDKK